MIPLNNQPDIKWIVDDSVAELKLQEYKKYSGTRDRSGNKVPVDKLKTKNRAKAKAARKARKK
jgi:hypothetical protein